MKTKVTALLDTDLIQTTQALSHASNITQSISIALKEWCAMKELQHAHQQTKTRPLEFQSHFSATGVRAVNR